MIRKVVLIVAGLLMSVGFAVGQEACSRLIVRALQAVADNCSDLSRNTACYAYNQVQATFLQDVSNDFFSQPSDRADLTYLDTIQTIPLDEDNDLWGIAMMSVQANVPNTLPGQAVIFMLMGDAQVENAVAPEDIFEPADPVDVTTLATSSNIRVIPSATGFVLGVVPLGTAFEADGLSADEEWVRIIFDDQPAWISRSIIDSEGNLSELPVISEANRTPMQAFYFSTGAGVSTCNEAPDSLLIQGPNSLEVVINANGVDINIGSTIVLESSGENQVSITAINGYARVENIRIPGGFTIDAQTDEQGNIIPETLAGLRPMEDDKIERFKSLEMIDSEVINYQVRVPTRADINVVQRELEAGQAREDIRARCVENGLSVEQCQSFVGRDTDQSTIYRRCVASGLSAEQCRDALGFDGSVGDDGGIFGSGAVLERCQQSGFETLGACRAEFSGESDERINICMSLGYNSRQSCRDAFPEDGIDRLLYCVSNGYSSKAECDAADAGTTDETGEDSTSQSQCEAQGLTPKQCKIAKAYKKCRNQGFTHAQCVQIIGGGGS